MVMSGTELLDWFTGLTFELELSVPQDLLPIRSDVLN